jgi:hypothetical protein
MHAWQLRVGHARGQLEVEHEQRDGNRHHSIREGYEAIGGIGRMVAAALVHVEAATRRSRSLLVELLCALPSSRARH